MKLLRLMKTVKNIKYNIITYSCLPIDVNNASLHFLPILLQKSQKAKI